MVKKYSFIIQARSESKRLPAKVLIPFYERETILDLQIRNLQKSFPESSLILATSTNKADDKIEEKYLNNKSVKLFRGDENNVLKRFIDAATQFDVENIIRVCSDNPFLSMPYMSQLIDKYFNTKSEYVSFQFNNGTPSIKSHSGLFAEMVNINALKKIELNTVNPLYLEHVTNYIYSHSELFEIEFIPVPSFLEEYVNKLRLTIDTPQDFMSLQKLYLAVLSKFGTEYTLEQLLSEINQNADLLKSMNEQIENHAK